MSRDLSELAKTVAGIVRDAKRSLEEKLSGEVGRLEALFRSIPAGPKGDPGEAGKDGRDGTDGKDGAPGKDGNAGLRGEPGEPGESVKGEKGDTGERGVAGKDAELPDIDAIVQRAMESQVNQWALDFERRAQELFQRAIDKMPKPVDGKDGFSFEDFSVTDDGHGRAVLTFSRGELVRSFSLRIPCFEYLGVWREGTYERGNNVTWAGSVWVCVVERTTQKPGNGCVDWQLAVKRGEDGRAGKDGDRGPQGPAGGKH